MRSFRKAGLRIALGDNDRAVLGGILAQGLKPVLVGLGLGLGLSLAAGRRLAARLFSISPYDPALLALVLGGIGACALGACLLPARRAVSVDPAEALRAE